ncbi:MAG: alkaline phosphatase family protein [Turicibacter sp.]|nr:alkaline phosphatase family protein [Turicibacter sp.]
MKKKLLLISLDAMIGKDIEILKTLPTFGPILEKASIVKSVETVYPSMTYTAHASIVSGTYPEKHGVITNEVFTPLVSQAPWYELRLQNKAQILPELAKENGYTTFVNSWPTLVGANVDYLVQRAGIHYPKEEQESEIRKNSNDVLTQEMWDYCAEAWTLPNYYSTDKFSALASKYVINRYQPDLTLMHMTLPDHYRHSYGVLSEKLVDAYKYLDDMLAIVVDELKAQGLYEQTTFVFCSDHGQVDIDMSVNANKLLIENGLLTVDEEGKMTDWKAYIQSSAVSAHVYLKDPTDEALANEVYRLLDANRELLYIEHIFTREQVKKTYRLDGDFSFVLESKEGSSFGFNIMADYQNPIMNEDYRVSRGTHGHIPSKGEQPCLILSGPGVLEGKELSVAKVVDIAPTCAAILGFEMPEADGRILREILVD